MSYIDQLYKSTQQLNSKQNVESEIKEIEKQLTNLESQFSFSKVTLEAYQQKKGLLLRRLEGLKR